MAETVKKNNPVAVSLLGKGTNFSFRDRTELTQLLGELTSRVIAEYHQLQQAGQIELSVTPDKHPIVPLLQDFHAAREAWPDCSLPKEPEYPGGEARAQLHIDRSIQTFQKYFGHTPPGCWPSEGGLSQPTLAALDKAGFSWTATGGNVLNHSKRASKLEQLCIHHAFKVKGSDITCFFRDDNLSDLIGFSYSGWNATDAVGDLVHHIMNIRNACKQQQDAIVPIILDGENCWEYYHENGIEFLEELYQTLASYPDIHLTTFDNYLSEHHHPTTLDTLVAGSWVYGNFSTWMGDKDKNRGWDILCQAKKDFDKVTAEHSLTPEKLNDADRQLAICEGSDWFWWFGDYNPSESVLDFETLYRTHLKNLYRYLELPMPAHLEETISVGGGGDNAENSGTMRRGSND